MLDLIVWYLIITLVGFLALPVAHRLLPNLADRGYIFTRALGLLLWGFAFWLLTSFHILQNNTGGELVALALLALVSLWIGGGLKGWGEALGFLRSRLRLVLVTEVLFLLAFCFLALTRAASPDISGTEKPMELAFINSILHSASFPPADPWLAGYAISYYYFGYVLVAMLIRLSGVSVGVGFNLAISLWYAMTALGAFGVAFSILATWSRRRQAEEKKGLLALPWALLAPFYVLVVSNIEGFLEMLHAKGILWDQTASGMQSGFWAWIKLPELVDPPALPLSWVPNRPGGIWWWIGSRVVQDYTLDGIRREAIDEFPFFTYYLADLHPHVLSMPFVLLAIALGLNLYLWGSTRRFSDLRLRNWVTKTDFWLAAVVLGGLAFLNTWDFPIYLALFSAVYTLVRFQQEGWRWKERLSDFFGVAIGLGAAGVVLYLPFYFGFQSQAGGILPSLAFFTRGVAFWIMFAPMLIPLFAWLVWLWRHEGGRSSLKTGLRFSLGLIAALWAFSWLLGLFGGLLPALGNLLAGSQTPAVASLGANLVNIGGLFIFNQGGISLPFLLTDALVLRFASPGTWLTLGILLVLVWGLLSTFAGKRAPALDLEEASLSSMSQTDPADEAVFTKMKRSVEIPGEPRSLGSPNAFLLLMILVGAGLTLLPEFVYLRDQFGVRMNTIFKFYFQTWILWGTAAAVVSAILWTQLRRAGRWIFGAAWIVVLLIALPYSYFALADRLNFSQAQSWTLDGTASFASYSADDYAAVKWLDTAPYGAVAEAVGGQYSAYARIATFSGLPTVLGWPGHELQWRGSGKEIGSRESDIDLLYRTSDWNEALRISSQYNIRYIIIGNLERGKYKVNENKFKSHIVPVFQSGSTVIYEMPALEGTQ